ncbi:hypothetical protein SPBRAN_1796 [uncultured Candidatus Thioglobus sp.]|nr:hypothetical protein SPBRAN_1796 [uncultured Candidatus Thioglobus sp.]
MLNISIGEIQRNTAILSNLTEPLAVFDRRKNKQVAIIYPVQSQAKTPSIVEELAGKYKHFIKINLNDEELDEAIRKSSEEAAVERYQRYLQQCEEDDKKI